MHATDRFCLPLQALCASLMLSIEFLISYLVLRDCFFLYRRHNGRRQDNQIRCRPEDLAETGTSFYSAIPEEAQSSAEEEEGQAYSRPIWVRHSRRY